MAITNASQTLSQAANDPTVQQSAASQQQTAQAGSQANAGTGIFNWQLPNIVPSLDQFLGLPDVIDWQDIGIRVSMVVVGIVLLILVGWAFINGKQQTTVTVVNPVHQSGSTNETAEEAMEVGA